MHRLDWVGSFEPLFVLISLQYEQIRCALSLISDHYSTVDIVSYMIYKHLTRFYLGSTTIKSQLYDS